MKLAWSPPTLHGKTPGSHMRPLQGSGTFSTRTGEPSCPLCPNPGPFKLWFVSAWLVVYCSQLQQGVSAGLLAREKSSRLRPCWDLVRDFRSVDFRFVDFRSADFRSADFLSINFRSADFWFADFQTAEHLRGLKQNFFTWRTVTQDQWLELSAQCVEKNVRFSISSVAFSFSVASRVKRSFPPSIQECERVLGSPNFRPYINNHHLHFLHVHVHAALPTEVQRCAKQSLHQGPDSGKGGSRGGVLSLSPWKFDFQLNPPCLSPLLCAN